MPDIKIYDKVKLNDGREASIVEILGKQEAYIADIDIGGDYNTETIYPQQIEQVIN